MRTFLDRLGFAIYVPCAMQITRVAEQIAVFKLAFVCVLTNEAVVMQGRGGSCVGRGSTGVHQCGV